MEYPKVVPSELTPDEQDAAIATFIALYGDSPDEQYAATGMVAEDLRWRIIWSPLEEDARD